MPKYRIHFCHEPTDPFPPLDTLPEVEALDPLSAIEELLAQGRHPQDRTLRWARAIVNYHDDGKPRQVLRVGLEATVVGKIESYRLVDHEAR